MREAPRGGRQALSLQLGIGRVEVTGVQVAKRHPADVALLEYRFVMERYWVTLSGRTVALMPGSHSSTMKRASGCLLGSM